MKRTVFKFGIPSQIADPSPLELMAYADGSSGAADAGKLEVLLPQDPPLPPLDESILLLHTAAEVEHSLLAQYLYAAYSLPASGLEGSWRSALLGIAREEMAHLLGVQNILLALGGALNFEREDFPFRTFYPFPFELKPFSLRSAARYLLAEMPDLDKIPTFLGFDINEVRTDADLQGETMTINRVGLLYERLQTTVSALSANDFHADSISLQADPGDWGAAQFNLVLSTVSSQANALDLLHGIGEQGEGPEEPTSGPPSHFRRFFTLYRAMKQAGDFARIHVPSNPTTVLDQSPGYLSNKSARRWATLINVHYRSLLSLLAHQLSLGRDVAGEKPQRNQLRSWSHREMLWIRDCATELSQLPQHDPPQFDANGELFVAGIPFELPYTLSLPIRKVDCWRHHLMLARFRISLVEELRVDFPFAVVLDDLAAWEADRIALITPLT